MTGAIRQNAWSAQRRAWSVREADVAGDTVFTIPLGFRAAASRAGIKPSGGLDLAVLVSDQPCAAAGTFTTNRIAAAPVQRDRRLVPANAVRAIVVNAGNANAATGAQGLANASRTAELAASALGCSATDILVASTGVIGHQLPMDRLEDGLRRALAALSDQQAAFHEASSAILTTDTRPKVLSVQRTVDDAQITLLGLCKGAAMIGPRMATMLGFLLTDAAVSANELDRILHTAVDESFNCISVEGHTSTNDTVLLLANGQAKNDPLAGASLATFEGMVREACIALARMIPADGEGAEHFITIDVEGCRDREEARTLARAVADSPLVKTAIHGGDPNWGRIVSAAGYAGIPFDESGVSLWLNDALLYRSGGPVPFDAARASAHLKSQRDTHIRLVFSDGQARIRFWTCDLTAEYVRLNADYTT
jgi:glutamate N-acetyltransferase/amino-acid N-acetyltransferase